MLRRVECCLLLAVLPACVVCSPAKMDMNKQDDTPIAVDELSNFEEGDLIADNKAYSMVGSSGNTKIGLHDNARLWPGGKVPYKIFDSEKDPNIHDLTIDAINVINEIQCVEFVEEENPKRDYINIVLGDKLSSQLGYQRNGAQDLTISDMPYLGTGPIMHELMHSIGFGHEHNRPNRDEYVEIQWKNLKEGEDESYFRMYNPNGNFSTDNLLKYDRNSIMHATSFISRLAVDGNKPVIVGINLEDPEDDPEDLGQRNHLTDLDIQRIQRMYSCDICTGENDGAIFRYPGDCTKYYICEYGKPRQMPCNADLHINVYKDPPQCDWPDQANCTEFFNLWN